MPSVMLTAKFVEGIKATAGGRDRVLNDGELRTLWKELEALGPVLGAFYKLRLLTAQRAGEGASMTWADLDLESGWWVIPATIAKNKLAHRVALSSTMLKLLVALRDAEPHHYVRRNGTSIGVGDGLWRYSPVHDQ